MNIGTDPRKPLLLLLAAVMITIAILPTAAFAKINGDINAKESTVTENREEKEDTDPTADTSGTDDIDSTTGETDALTPEGNLTLVDDVGTATDTTATSGKQFLTLVTRNGTYFYLIIDRDGTGEGTVHFLNQVDEADLLALLDSDTREAYDDDEDLILLPEEPEEEAASHFPGEPGNETPSTCRESPENDDVEGSDPSSGIPDRFTEADPDPDPDDDLFRKFTRLV